MVHMVPALWVWCTGVSNAASILPMAVQGTVLSKHVHGTPICPQDTWGPSRHHPLHPWWQGVTDVVFYSHQTMLLGQLLLWYVTWIKDETIHSMLICCNCDLQWKAPVYTSNEFCRDGINATKHCRSVFHKAAWAWHEDHGTLNSESVIVMFVRGEQEGKSLSSTAQCSFNEEWGLLRSHPTTEEELTPLVVNILRKADSPR